MYSKAKINLRLAFYLIIISHIFFYGCTTKPSTENEDSISVKSDSISKSVGSEIVDAKSFLRLVLFNASGSERAKSIGKNIADVLKTEKLELVDSASNFKSLTQYFHDSDDEFVDIQYYFGGDIVTGLNLDIYLNDVVDVKNLIGELTLAFNEKYGKSIFKEDKYTWLMPDKQQVTIKDVSLKLAPGLQVTFSKSGQNMIIQ